MVTGKNYQWMLKSLDKKYDEKQNICIVSKYFPTRKTRKEKE